MTIQQQDNFGKKPTAYLPEIIVKGATDPVVQVVEEKSGEILYTLRIQGSRFQPWVFAPGQYTVFVGSDHLGRESSHKALRGLVASPRRDRVPVRIGF